MSNKVIPVALSMLAGVLFLAAGAQGCGGGSNGTGAAGSSGSAGSTGSAGTTGSGGVGAVVVDLCNKTCEKENACGNLQPPLTVEVCKGFCPQLGTTGAAGSGGSGQNQCPNLTPAQFQQMANACFAMGCDQYADCLDAICPSATGSAGTGGGAGTGATGSAGTGATGTAGTGSTPTGAAGTGATGAAGAGGGECTTVCAKAQTCCGGLKTAGIYPANTDCTVFSSGCAQSAAQAQMACQSVLTAGSALNAAGCK
jgi:hypothetical protein